MQRISVVGLGQMGLSALAILHDRLPDARFVALDRSMDAVRRAAAVGPRVEGRIEDVLSGELDLSGVDLVLNLAGPFFTGSDAVARAAIAAGAAYVDIADDIEGTEAILALHEAATAAGVPLVTGAGLSPGVSNWLACRLLDRHPEADGIQVAWVVHESDPGGLAPLRHMLHMAVNRCPVYRSGNWDSSPGFVPSTAASYVFPDPVGEVEAYDTAHPEPRTLVRQYPHLQYANCKGALQPGWANQAFSTLGRIGFGYSDVQVEVNGAQAEPAEFLWKLMWARFERRPARERTACTAVLVQALRGDDVLGAMAIIDDDVMARGTGLGAAAAVIALLERGAPVGAWGPEALAWEVALPLFEQLGRARGGYGAGVVDMTVSGAI
jgi:saccharopine dehydrogenase-like NADP-dependent oxidoreductase